MSENIDQMEYCNNNSNDNDNRYAVSETLYAARLVTMNFQPIVRNTEYTYIFDKYYSTHVYRLSKSLARLLSIPYYQYLTPTQIIQYLHVYLRLNNGFTPNGSYEFDQELWDILDISYDTSLSIINVCPYLAKHYM